jgi:hypothetical protein
LLIQVTSAAFLPSFHLIWSSFCASKSASINCF